MLTPPLSSAPFCKAAPERMLPVCPGWMPTPVAFLLNRPLTTLTLVLTGASGSRLLPSCMSAPSPLAHQWLPLIPQPMNRAANRFGATGTPPFTGGLPQTGTDSSHGRAIVTPTPRRNVRRETVRLGSDALMAFVPLRVRRLVG